MGVSPRGQRRRVKILSTSTLRGQLKRRLAPARFALRGGWLAPAPLIEGLRFRLLETEHEPLTVKRYEPGARELELSAPLAAEISATAPFELISPEESPIFAARLLTGTPPPAPLPPCLMRLATTLGTNTLLERTGAPVALLLTAGFGDLLLIGTQQRPELFSLQVERPPPLAQTTIEVRERVDAGGHVLQELELDTWAGEAQALVASGMRTAAVALLHSHRSPAHEQELKRRLLSLGFEHVSCSAELAPRMHFLSRAQTALVDAYLAPVLQRHLERVQAPLPSPLLVMTSAGGLVRAGGFHPKDSLLSGPAGGLVGATLAGRQAGCRQLITFDMGGTSTDVARFAGDYEYRYEHEVGGAAVLAPALAIESVAAGGGSVCWLDGPRLCVGPHSAGARPGPACYGAGGPLTLTDVNLLLGRLDPGRFGIPIQVEPARRRLDELRQELSQRTGEDASRESLLSGLLAVASEVMADAIRRVSIRRGFDPAEHTLVAFGGAGGQHACAVAELLGIGQVLVPVDAAFLSARGLGHARLERFVERQLLEPLDSIEPQLPELFQQLSAEAIQAVAAEGVPQGGIVVWRRIVHARFAGQEATLELEWRPGQRVRDSFEALHEQLFGHRPESRPIEVESLKVLAGSAAAATTEVTASEAAAPYEAPPAETRSVLFGDTWRTTAVFERSKLRPGAALSGPALVLEQHSATVIEPGWRARLDERGGLLLEREQAPTRVTLDRPEAIRLELFTQRFHALVREMGERLERTAVSTNVKERLDFSCALLDPDGELVANAPHIPVHLGALGLCVRRLRDALPLNEGDVAVTNHPAYGGSHLPDLTVVTPVHIGSTLIGYVANRAHHAEIGGLSPGSMPPAARVLGEEGVVIPPTYLVQGGQTRWEQIQQQLQQAPLPSRNVEDNMADLRAAVAANHAGAVGLRTLVQTHGRDTVLRYMQALKSLCESKAREALSSLAREHYEATEHLDDGTPLAVTLKIANGHAHIDFSGSGPVHHGNLNATPAIVTSAVMYVLRLLLKEPLPLNEGLMRAVTLHLPIGILNPEFHDDPMRSPAVAGGNVETSQRLVDTLLKALELAACSQGTMNNLVFGNARYGYYETLGGGCGAGPGFAGASAVHSHMTNTRITDAEVLEHRYPVRVERFAVRRGSGGAGLFQGGDGLVRALLFLEPVSLSILSQHRTVRPYGLSGGQPGMPGRQWVERASGERVELGPIDGCELQAGDRLIVETPGGGGVGEPV